MAHIVPIMMMPGMPLDPNRHRLAYGSPGSLGSSSPEPPPDGKAVAILLALIAVVVLILGGVVLALL